MNDNGAREFLDRLETDTSFRNAIAAAEHPASKGQIVKAAGYTFTPDELNEILSSPDTGEEVRQMAVDAVKNIAPKDLDFHAVGFWMWPW